MKSKTFTTTVVISLACAASSAANAQASKLDEVKQSGVVRCGVLANSVGRSVLNDKGQWTGFDIDYCKALAAAVFNDPTKLDVRPAAMGQQLAALKSGELDVLAAALTWSMSREVALNYAYIGPTVSTGVTFMVHAGGNVKTIKGLNGATICLQAGSLTEEAAPEYMRQNKIAFTPLSVASLQQMYANYDSKRCDAVTGDRLTMEARKLERPVPQAHLVLQESYAKSDSGPVVRGGDPAWHNVAQYVHYAMVTAEELGITQANVDRMKTSPQGDVRRFLGVEGGLGSKLGLRDDWTVAVIKAVGNYGEAWERNLGKGSPLQLPREQNKLARDGGLLVSPVWR